MAKSLADVQKVTAKEPPRLLIYGPPGMGKTSLASDAPQPIFIQVERGTAAGMTLDSFGDINSYEDVKDALRALYREDHDYKTVVIDSADALEPLLWEQCCRDNGWSSVEDPGYGKGYIELDAYWQKLFVMLNTLNRQTGMGIVIIAHSHIVSFPNPTGTDFPRWDFRLHKRAHGIIEDSVDAVLMIGHDAITAVDKKDPKKQAKATGGSSRWIFCEGAPNLNAKNRYNMPSKLLYEKGEGWNALAEYFPKNPQHIEA